MIKHVKPTRLFVCRGLAAAALGCLALTANAFEQAIPPAGWSAGGGPGGSVTGTKAVNAMFANGGVSSNASIRASGRLVTIPALMKYTANAPRVAATAIMLHPGVRTAATVAGWLGLAGLVYDATSGLWTAPDDQYQISSGYKYASPNNNPRVYFDSLTELGQHRAAQRTAIYGFPVNFDGVVNDRLAFSWKQTSGDTEAYLTSASSCPAGWYITPAGCVQSPPPKTLTEQEAIDEIIKHPMPEDAPKYIPEPLPVEMPYFEPLFIPTGNPVANPSYNPSAPASPENQPYVQPGTKVTPAPAPGAPWQVQTTPVNRPTPTPEGSTEPTTETSPETPREPQKEERDFCEKNPEALACAEADTPEQETPTGQLNIGYEYVDIFGNGSCPSDSYLNTHGQNLKVWDWAATCDNVQSYFRPILIACCAFAAFVIVSAGAKE